MGHQAFDVGVAAIEDRGRQIGRTIAAAQTAHAGIDFQVVGEGLAGGGGELVGLADLLP